VSAKRVRLIVLGTAALACLSTVGLICCTRPPAAEVSATPPRASEPEKQTEDSGIPQQAARTPPEESASTPPATIDMDTPEEPAPVPPSYMSIVEEIDPVKRSIVYTTIEPPRTLELTTENVKRIRLTREGLPLARHGSLVLRIDGQGIEWTRKYVAVELERSSAGEWSVVDRRPANP
jgi:hypothetical protein